MTVKEYLLNEPPIKLAFIAGKMYPDNKNAASALNNKLKGEQNRQFSKKDAELALSVLKEICADIRKLKP